MVYVPSTPSHGPSFPPSYLWRLLIPEVPTAFQGGGGQDDTLYTSAQSVHMYIFLGLTYQAY